MGRPQLNSNSTPFRRMLRRLESGMYNLRIAQTRTTTLSKLGITHYLLPDGVILPFRQWYQKGKPQYIVAGSKEGCAAHWQRVKSISI
jgi:hypothetical protein